jgi:long-chain acyl-CoA synthetase
LLIGGPILISRYHRDPENTKKSIDEDGWFHTGDIAAIDHAGRVKIVDRIKNVMKLSQG